jgi:hypothetical protein
LYFFLYFRTAGPVLGGLLANPATQFPNIFGGIALLEQFPYFLPCFISAIISIIGLIMTYFYFEETNPNLRDNYSQPPSITESLMSIVDPRLTQTLSNMFGSVDAFPRRFSIAGNDQIAGVEIQPQESIYKQIMEEYGNSVATNSNSMAELVTGYGMVQPVMDLPEMVRTVTQSTTTGNNFSQDAEYHANYGELNPNNGDDSMRYCVITETEQETILSRAVPESEVADLVEGQQSLVNEWRDDDEGGTPDEVRTVVLMFPEAMAAPEEEKKGWGLGLGVSELSINVIISYT